MIDWERARGRRCAGSSATTRARAAMRCAIGTGSRSSIPLHWNEDLFGPPAHVLAAASEARRPWRTSIPSAPYADFREALAALARTCPTATVIPAHGAQALISSIARRLHRRRHAGRRAAADLRAVRAGLCRRRRHRDARRSRRPGARPRGHRRSRAPGRRAGRLDLRPEQPDRHADRARRAGRRSSTRFRTDASVVADEAYIDFADPALALRPRAGRARPAGP